MACRKRGREARKTVVEDMVFVGMLRLRVCDISYRNEKKGKIKRVSSYWRGERKSQSTMTQLKMDRVKGDRNWVTHSCCFFFYLMRERKSRVFGREA